jgi:hypothetical protein
MLQHSGARLAELAGCYNSLERLGCAGLAGPWDVVCTPSPSAGTSQTLTVRVPLGPGIYRLLEGRQPALARLPGCVLRGGDQGQSSVL